MPTDANQSTGLERFEILGKMQGIDVFDMRPLDSSRVGGLYLFIGSPDGESQTRSGKTLEPVC